VKAFAKQLIIVLSYMKRYNIIHCDLKPENILLVTSKKSAIKVIDFGTGCFENSTYYTYIQSRYYRAPEIMLGISYNCSIDMWSVGCIVIELFYGYPIFAGEDEAEQLAIIMEFIGMPPTKLLMVFA
jgi:dual specificity tyrosine-phosphorylation-regulated kinase 2/3/4